jgi:hypothetical protein
MISSNVSVSYNVLFLLSICVTQITKEPIVEDAPEGGYTARAVGVSIYTEVDNVTELHSQVRDAVCCHFEEAKLPKMIRLHFG